MSNTYIKFNDPGHGWLRVPLAELDALGIRNQISSYSYTKGDNAYLEEDCDYYMFDKAMKAAGREYTVIEQHTNNDSAIRNYRRMSA